MWGVYYEQMKAVGKAKKHPPPDLYEDLLFVWEFFVSLSSSRTNLEAIRFSEIESFLNLNGIFSLEQRQEITHLIRIMDLEYLKFMRKKYSAKI